MQVGIVGGEPWSWKTALYVNCEPERDSVGSGAGTCSGVCSRETGGREEAKMGRDEKNFVLWGGKVRGGISKILIWRLAAGMSQVMAGAGPSDSEEGAHFVAGGGWQSVALSQGVSIVITSYVAGDCIVSNRFCNLESVGTGRSFIGTQSL